jgi:hypothetical protein
MSTLRVGFDLDGVLYNFGDSVRRYLEFTGQGHIWKSGPTKEAYWDFYKDWGWTSKQFVEFCNEGADAGFIFCGDARPGAAEAVQAIKAMGHTIHIITDRSFGSAPAISHSNTSNWLKQHGIPYDSLTFTADKTIVRVDAMIEDKLENYDALEANGTWTFLINRAWNQVPGDVARRRIDELSEYVQAIEDETRVRHLIGV